MLYYSVQTEKWFSDEIWFPEHFEENIMQY